MNSKHLVFIAGLSGAGKTTVMKAFDDLGYFSVDTLPAGLLVDFLKIAGADSKSYSKAAVHLELNSEDNTRLFLKSIAPLRDSLGIDLIFLESSNETLFRRFNETRRPHPLFNNATDTHIEQAIIRERIILNPFKEAANRCISTTTLTVHDLRRKITEIVESKTQSCVGIRANLISFGFKFGAPSDLDLLVDVRFMPNPYFIDTLRLKTGMDSEVKDFVLSQPDTHEFLIKYGDLINFLLPKYLFEGKRYLNIGVGCTGGKHRSVSIANELSNIIKADKVILTVEHRDLNR